MELVIDNLIKAYKKRTVVNGVSLKLAQGEVVGLLGPNGAGKTTSFYMAVGVVKADKGSIFLGENDITNLPLHLRARLGLGYLPQEASIFRGLTVEENILAILETTSYSREKQLAKMNALIDEFNVAHVRERKGSELSGGERRRVEIARALAMEPKFILLDEPFAGVDPIAVADIQQIIGYLKKRGIGVLITDHNVRETLTICDRAYIMNEGQILLEGEPNYIANSELAKKFYLGESFTM